MFALCASVLTVHHQFNLRTMAFCALLSNLRSPTARDLASRMDEGDLEEWMDVDNALATGRHYSDSEIVQMAVYQDKEDSGEERCCNENEENRRENTY
ncbi:hypothetical protein M513_08906 [Trichuris suis]|uniref:Uncharacterized protein n=1 Tax=Trichuris suis TaxID=68888 RepID=A0A085LZ82_9BILA|nr:hypothetical protein M513_08906 [Trichuris suis]